MTVRLAATAAFALLVAGAASAQSTTGAITLGFGWSDVDDNDFRTASLDGTLNADFGNGFSLGLDGTTMHVSQDDVDDITATSIAAQGAYTFGGGLALGGYLEHLGSDSNFLGFGESLTSYGVTGGLTGDRYGVEAFYGASDYDDLDSDIDVRDFGLRFTLDAGEDTGFSGYVMRTRFSAGGSHANIDGYALSGHHFVGDKVALFGSMSKTSIELGDLDVTTVSIGASYAFGIGGVPLVGGLEVAHSTLDDDGDSDALNTIRLSLTVPFGATGPTVPLNSTASRIERSRHSALSGLIFTLY